MQVEMEKLVTAFESGRLTRRQLLRRLTALTAWVSLPRVPALAAKEAPATFTAVGLNHIALNVTDIPRSRDFYVRHLDLQVTYDGSSGCFLKCGDQFVALFQAEKAGMNHYCYSVPEYSVGTAARKLEAAGLAPRPRGDRIYFDDPDGLEVQLSSPEHGI